MPAYTYGTFSFNDGINFFLMEKPFDFPTYQQALYKVGRMEGVKKSSEVVNERIIAIKVKVVGISRADLEGQLETMYQNLALRQQQLTLYAIDNRYFVADCTDVKTVMASGLPTSAIATVTFTCQQPYAFAQAPSSYSSGVMTATPSGGVCTYPVQNVSGGGSIFSRPTITITQTGGTATAWTSLTINQQTDNQLITVTAPLPTANGDTMTFYCDPTQSASGYTVQKNGNGVPVPFVGQFPYLEYTNTAWLVTINAPGPTSIIFGLAWTARWVG